MPRTKSSRIDAEDAASLLEGLGASRIRQDGKHSIFQWEGQSLPLPRTGPLSQNVGASLRRFLKPVIRAQLTVKHGQTLSQEEAVTRLRLSRKLRTAGFPVYWVREVCALRDQPQVTHLQKIPSTVTLDALAPTDTAKPAPPPEIGEYGRAMARKTVRTLAREEVLSDVIHSLLELTKLALEELQKLFPRRDDEVH